MLMLDLLKVCGVMLMALRETLCRVAVKESPDTLRIGGEAEDWALRRGDRRNTGVSVSWGEL